MRAAALTRAAAVFALALALALVACHPDDNRLADADQPPVPLCANATLPTTAQGTVTRADAGDAAPIQLAQAASLILWQQSSTSSAMDGKGYTLQADATTGAYSLTYAGTPGADFHVIPGSTAYFRIQETSLPLQMALKPNATGTGTGSSTGSGTGTPVQVPFLANIKYPGTDGALTAIGLGGSATLPLQYTTCALRLRLKYADGGQGTGADDARVTQVACQLPMTSISIYGTKETSKSPTRTDGKTDAPATPATEQTVIFGQVKPGSTLTPGSTRIALLTTAGGDLLSLAWPAGATIKQTPAAGQMLTLTVHVGRSVAYIDPAGITISGFQEQNGDGDGEDLVQGYYAEGDGLQPLDPDVFCAANPSWTVTGGEADGTSGSGADATVLGNVRTALSAIKDANGNTGTNYTGPGIINLTLTEVTTLPKNSNVGAFQGYKQLRSVNLPAATSIGDGAFYKCTTLTSINLPKVTSIGNYAFDDCSALTSINLPAVTDIVLSLAPCSALTSISLPKVTSISQSAFISCQSLISADLPAATSIGEFVFESCRKITSISLPAVKKVGYNAFTGCSALTYLDLSGITETGNNGLHSTAFDAYDQDPTTSTQTCHLVLGRTFYDAQLASGGITITENPDGTKTYQFFGRTWKLITYKDTPSN